MGAVLFADRFRRPSLCRISLQPDRLEFKFGGVGYC